jgi:cytochrome P450
MDSTFLGAVSSYGRQEAVAVSFATIVVIFVMLMRRRYFSGISQFNGPLLASVSAVWQIWHVAKGDIEYAVLQEHKKHGSYRLILTLNHMEIMAYIPIGDFVRISHQEVSCSHPDSIKAILAPPHRKVSHSDSKKSENSITFMNVTNFIQASWYQALAVPDKYHQTPMSECDPRRHRERSSITASSYTLSYLIQSEGRVDKCIQELQEQLTRLSKAKNAIHFDYWLNYVAFDIIGELTFSKNFGFVREGADIDNSIGSMRFLMIYQAIMGYMYWLHPFILHSPLAGYFGLKPHAHIFRTVSAAVQERQDNKNTNVDMVSQWIANHKKWPTRMEEREILAVSGMTTIAGSETMTGALESFFYFLLKNPECMSKLKEELKEARWAGKLSSVVKHEEAKQLPYLQACVSFFHRFSIVIFYFLC